jgi:hypothetical protein
MHTMTQPGFTAESSVYRTSGHYQMTAGFAAHGNVVRPQACDLTCLADCYDSCVELPPRFRAGCRQQCHVECCPPPVTCGPCVGFRQCSDGTQRACSV